MRHINHCNTLQDRAVPTDGSFGIPYFMKTRMTGSGTERKGKRGIYSHWQTGNYRAKLANASFRTARSGLSGFGKNHPHFVPVFFPKTLPYRKHLP